MSSNLNIYFFLLSKYGKTDKSSISWNVNKNWVRSRNKLFFFVFYNVMFSRIIFGFIINAFVFNFFLECINCHKTIFSFQHKLRFCKIKSKIRKFSLWLVLMFFVIRFNFKCWFLQFFHSFYKSTYLNNHNFFSY